MPYHPATNTNTSRQCRITQLQTRHVSVVSPCYKHITSVSYHPATNTSRQCRITLLQTHHVSAVPPCYKHFTSAPYHPATNTSRQCRITLLQTHHVSAVPPCYKHFTSAPYHPATNTSRQCRITLLQTHHVSAVPPCYKRTCGKVCAELLKVSAHRCSARIRSSAFDRLDSFLLAYRNTPHATTCQAPTTLMLGHNIRSYLGLLKSTILPSDVTMCVTIAILLPNWMCNMTP